MAIIDNNIAYLGTEVDLVLESIEKIHEYDLSEILDHIIVFSNKETKCIKKYKRELSPFQNDPNKYLVRVDTENIGIGLIKIKIVVKIPDSNNSNRTEIYPYNTGIYVVDTI